MDCGIIHDPLLGAVTYILVTDLVNSVCVCEVCSGAVHM